jgi:hypothetical protein
MEPSNATRYPSGSGSDFERSEKSGARDDIPTSARNSASFNMLMCESPISGIISIKLWTICSIGLTSPARGDPQIQIGGSFMNQESRGAQQNDGACDLEKYRGENRRPISACIRM